MVPNTDQMDEDDRPTQALAVKSGEVMAPDGEIVERAITPVQAQGGGVLAYSGAGDLGLTLEQKKELIAPFSMDDIDILPTGELYVQQIGYRRRLNTVFGPGSWAMVPQGPPKMQGQTIMQEWHMIVYGKFAASAWGEADYKGNNDRVSEATAVESAKSTALVRCCKDLGIGSECWDKRFITKFKQETAICVKAPKYGKPTDEMVWMWRRKDGRPFKGEAKP